ncbi:MAG: hypothetical protein AAF212_00825 [Verrucomicrobiota bacterium]
MTTSLNKRTALHIFVDVFQPGVRAFHAYWRVILAFQFCGLIFVVGFYQLEIVRDAAALVTTLQAQGGVLFVALSNVVSGAVIPETVKLRFRAKVEAPITWKDFFFRCTLMGLGGIIVFYFYRFQESLFGSNVDALTLLKKILFDQLVFSPFVGLPFIVIGFMLHESNYQWKIFTRELRLKNLCARVIPLWATALSFWPIMLTLIYSLPGPLQFTLFLFASAAWSLIMVLLASKQWTQCAN